MYNIPLSNVNTVSKAAKQYGMYTGDTTGYALGDGGNTGVISPPKHTIRTYSYKVPEANKPDSISPLTTGSRQELRSGFI